MKSVERKILFYHKLSSLLSLPVFSKEFAEVVVENYKNVKKFISCSVDFSVDLLKKLHDDYHGQKLLDEDWDTLDAIAESAFKDLAKHMRSSLVRQTVISLIHISGESSDTIVFVSKTNEKEMGRGFAVVTLVVSSSEGLDQLLSLNKMPRNKIETVHLV